MFRQKAAQDKAYASSQELSKLSSNDCLQQPFEPRVSPAGKGARPQLKGRTSVVEFSYKAQVVVAIECPNKLLNVFGAPDCLQTV